MRKNIFKYFNELIKADNSGSALIGFVLMAAVGSAYYITNSTGLIKDISQEKRKSEFDYYNTALSNGFFNYTVNAVKERWCMTDSWGRDAACKGPEMKDIVLNPLNLERFLWSKAAAIDINSRYKTKYNVPIPTPSTLKLLEHEVTLDKLDTLGNSHPLNILLNEQKIRNCLKSMTIKIERPEASQFIPLGDETSLIITIIKNLKTDIFGSCEFLKKKKVLKGLAIFFPRTLNQFSLIKSGDLDLTNFFGAKTLPGITFNGQVYLENNLILPNSGYAPITFKNTLRLGDGIIKYKDESKFTPKTPGLHSDILQSHYENFGGLFKGVGLENQVDEGIQALYGSTYTYPSGSNIAICAYRKTLKDNPSLTKDSRLMIKSNGVVGNTHSFEFGLTLDNEFREYNYSSAVNGFFVHDELSTDIDQRVAKKFVTNFTQRTATDKPVIGIVTTLKHDGQDDRPKSLSDNDEDEFIHKTVMGRNNTIEYQLADTVFLQEQADALTPDGDGYLGLTASGNNFKPNDINDEGNADNLKQKYNNLKNKCDDLKSNNWDHSACNMTIKLNDRSNFDCSTLSGSDKDDCETDQAEADTELNEYNTAQTLYRTNLDSFIANPPKLEIKTTDVLSNKLGFQIKVINQANFNSPFVNNIDRLYMRISAFDFMVEGSQYPEAGKRTSWAHRPGPNKTNGNDDKKNTIYYDLNDNKFKHANDNVEITQRINANKDATDNPDGWSILREEAGGGIWNNNREPPVNIVDGNEYVIIPGDGLSTEDAKENDDNCDIDVEAIPVAEWDVSFTETTQFSWLYNVTSPGITVTDPSAVNKRDFYEFPAETHNEMVPGSRLPSYSIVKDCIINPNIKFVLGFFACDNLIIKPRTAKLDIIGTFIVKNLDIDSSALGAGVNFYSIWNQQAQKILQDKKWLERETSHQGKACSTILVPGWARNLSAGMIKDFNSCSPMKFIYAGANNFNWSTIDPEIGIDPNGNQNVTQSKIINRYRRYNSSIVWRREYSDE